jgi:Carbonic anhydrase
MPFVNEILEFNRNFVENKHYEAFDTTRFPDKRIAVLTCMDTRLTELLPAALGFKNGDIKIITNAGAMITHPYGSVMRSMLVAIYELGVQEILVIGHYGCGMKNLDSVALIEKMKEKGITQGKIDTVLADRIDIHRWLSGFDNPVSSVSETVELIKKHPLIPADINIYGFLIDPHTGKLDPIENEVE